MVFSSLTFLLFFFPITMILYFVRSDIRWRNIVLTILSLLFYAWGEPVWVLAMVGSTLVNFICTRMIVSARDQRVKRTWMTIGVVTSAAILFIFKYAAFFINTFLAIFSSHRITGFELPIGISFYTFQVLTYTVDVYRGKARAQTSFLNLMLYVSCFPQLIAGPIVQYADIEQQLTDRVSTPEGFAEGMQRFVVGLGKKVLLANICGAALTEMPLIGTGQALSMGGAWYAAFLYTLQIYFDFGGYSDMAIGMGRILGFTYKENFNYPYIATSVRDFWRRWHISLGAFFRDYVYIPLGGNRRGKSRTIFNTMVVWMLTGLWHGANWTFVLWGLFFGVLLIIDLLWTGEIKKHIPTPVNWLVTFLLIMISWVIFYYPSVGQAFRHIGAMLGLGAKGFMDDVSLRVIKTYSILPLIAFAAALPIAPRVKALVGSLSIQPRVIEIVRAVALTLLLILSVLFLVGQSYNPFIYFQF